MLLTIHVLLRIDMRYSAVLILSFKDVPIYSSDKLPLFELYSHATHMYLVFVQPLLASSIVYATSAYNVM